MLKPNATAIAAGDARSWMALSASLGSASLTGIDDLTLSLTAAELRINRGSGLKANVAAPAINWATAIPGGVIVRDVRQQPDDDHPRRRPADVLRQRGVQLLRLRRRQGRARLRPEDDPDRRPPDRSGPHQRPPDDARADAHRRLHRRQRHRLPLDSGTLAVATLKPAPPAAPGGTPDPRGWTTVYAQLNGATLAGLGSDFNLTAQTLQASRSTPPRAARPRRRR